MGPQWGAFCQITLTSCYTTIATLVCVLSYIWCVCGNCLVTYLGYCVADRRWNLNKFEQWQSSVPERYSPLLVAISLGGTKCRVKNWARVDHFWPLRNRFLLFDREYFENGKSESYMSIRAQRELSKNVGLCYGADIPKRVHYRKNMFHFEHFCNMVCDKRETSHAR